MTMEPLPKRRFLKTLGAFESSYQFLNEDLRRIDSKQGMYLRPGDVVLVRSNSIPEYGDHYMIVTGHPVMKEHGIRPQEVSIKAPGLKDILDKYDPKGEEHLILLKLSNEARDEFFKFHNIQLNKGEVMFPESMIQYGTKRSLH